MDALSFTPILQLCARTGHVEEALSWLQAMESRHIRPDVAAYTTVISACARSANAEVQLGAGFRGA